MGPLGVPVLEDRALLCRPPPHTHGGLFAVGGGPALLGLHPMPPLERGNHRLGDGNGSRMGTSGQNRLRYLLVSASEVSEPVDLHDRLNLCQDTSCFGIGY